MGARDEVGDRGRLERIPRVHRAVNGGDVDLRGIVVCGIDRGDVSRADDHPGVGEDLPRHFIFCRDERAAIGCDIGLRALGVGCVEEQAPGTGQVRGNFKFHSLGLLGLGVADDGRQETFVADVAAARAEVANDGRAEDRVVTADEAAGGVHGREILVGREPTEAHRNASPQWIEADARVRTARGRGREQRTVQTLNEEVGIKSSGEVAVDPEPRSGVERGADGEGIGSDVERGRIVIVAETITRVLRLGEDAARGDVGGGGNGQTRTGISGLRGTRGHAGGVFRNIRERGPILRRGGFKNHVTTTPTGGIIAREYGVFRLQVSEVATERADEDEAVFKHAEIARRHEVFKFGDVVGAVVFARGVEDALRRDIGDGAVVVAQGERAEVGVIEITAALIQVEAVPQRGAGLGRIPIASVGTDALEGQQIKVTALGLELIIEPTADRELQFTDGRFFDVGGGGPETLELVAAEILVIPKFAVRLLEVRVGGAVGEILRDVDIDGVGTAIDGVVTIDFDFVGIARDFEEERLADAVAEGEREVLGDLSLRRFAAGPEIGGRLRGDFKTDGAGESIVVTAGGHFVPIDHGLTGVAHTRARDGFTTDEITIGRGAVTLRAFRAENVGKIQDVTRAKCRGIVHPERRELRVGVVGAVADTRGGELRGRGRIGG